MHCLHLLVATIVVLSSTNAAADYIEVSPVRPLTMSDPSGLSSIALEFQLTRWTEPRAPALEVDFQSLTFDLAADIRLAPHWVLLARLPISQASIDGDPLLEDCCGFALGNLTAGVRGLWSSVLGNGRAVAGFELSASALTASDDGEGAVAASAAAFARLPHDPGRYAPDTTTFRLTTLAQFYSRMFLLQAEAGVQLFLYDGDDNDVAFRLALGAGIRASYKVAILAEINSLMFAGESASEDVASVDLGVRYASGSAIFGARIYVPIDSTLRDLDMFGVGLDLGLRF